MLSTSYQSPRFTLTSLLPLSRWMHPPHPAAGRLHLDALWWTAGAETSEREIYLRACCVRSSRLPSLPQASRSYDPPPPLPQLAHSRCPQSRASPPQITRVQCFPTPGMLRQDEVSPPPAILRQLTFGSGSLCVMWLERW